MFAVTGRGRTVGVVAGPEPEVLDDCAACGAGNAAEALRARQATGELDIVLCVDYLACCRRYRGGGSPAEYAELLAVAS